MATITSKRDDRMPAINSAVVHVQKIIPVVNGLAALGDFINVMAVAPKQKPRLVSASLRQSATLGASATAQLRAGGAAVTPATTAGAASKVDSSTMTNVPLDLNGGDMIDIAIAGAGITATATLTVDLFFAAREV